MRAIYWHALAWMLLWFCGSPPAPASAAGLPSQQGSSRELVKSIAPVLCPQDQRQADWSLKTPWSAVYAFTEGGICQSIHADDVPALRDEGLQFGLWTGRQERPDVKRKIRVWAALIDDRGTAEQMAENVRQILAQRPPLIDQHRQLRRDIHDLEKQLDDARVADDAATQVAVAAQDALEQQHEAAGTYHLIPPARDAVLQADQARKSQLSDLRAGILESIYALETVADSLVQQVDQLDAQVDGLLGLPALCRVAEIGSVEYLSEGGPPLDVNPAVGGGQRVFPDGVTADGAARRNLKVRVTANPPIPGLQFRVRIYDRDDPSTDRAPLDETGPDGGDDYGDAGTLDGSEDVLERTSGANGILDLTLTVGLQPGNNVDVVADCMHGVVGALTATQVSRNGASFRISAGPLTVWRRVHVERDAMPVVRQQDPKLKYYAPSGTIKDVRKLKGGKQATVTFTPNLTEQEVLIDSEDRFAGGLLREDGTALEFPIRASRGAGADVILEIDGIIEKPGKGKPIKELPDVGQGATLFDDDFEGTRERLLPAVLPPISLAQELFRGAYVEVSDGVPGVQNPDQATLSPVVSFETPGTRSVFLTQHMQSDGARQDHFWVAYLADAFQGAFESDFDPNTEDGAQAGLTVRPLEGGALFGAFLWRETHRDVGAHLGWTAPQLDFKRSKTAAHELAHQFGVDPDHKTGALLSSAATNGGSNDVVNPSPLLQTHLLQIRKYAESPGRRTSEAP